MTFENVAQIFKKFSAWRTDVFNFLTNLSSKLDKDSDAQTENDDIIELTQYLVIGFLIQMLQVNICKYIKNP